MQSRAGAETVLLFACYLSRLTGSLLEGAAGSALVGRCTRRLAAVLSRHVCKLPAPTATLVLLLLQQLGARFRALSGMISETRTMARLWGLLGLYVATKRLLHAAAAGKKSSSCSPWEDETTTLVAQGAQMASLVVYQAAENAAYLGSKKVLPLRGATQARLGLLSVRAWGVYVALEGARLLAERRRRRRRTSTSTGTSSTTAHTSSTTSTATTTTTTTGGEKGAAADLLPQEQQHEEEAAAAEEARWTDDWNKSFYRNLAWAPLTVHWGTAAGFLPDLAVSLLAFYPSAGAMRDLWRSTA